MTAHRFDLQDFLIAAGFLALETGVAVIYWPAALILGGVICFTCALLIERAQAAAVRAAVRRAAEE